MPEQSMRGVDKVHAEEVVEPQTVEIDGVEYDVRLCTAEEAFFAEWGRESLKQTIPFLNDAIQKLITLDAALIGGGLLLGPHKDVLPPGGRVFALGCFVLSLLFAVVAAW